MIRLWLRTLLSVLIFGSLVSGVHHLTKERIEQAHVDYIDQQIGALLPPGSFDPPLIVASRSVMIGHHAKPATVYFAQRAGSTVATLIDMITEDGYSGEIRLVVAIDQNATIIGVRALSHRETPGLGDAIDEDKSDWIQQFQGRTWNADDRQHWEPDRMGGDFDTISSATITSKAVILAVADALEAFQKHRDTDWSHTP